MGTLLAGGAALVAAVWPVAWVPVCLFHRLTGIPCPTCGATRCVKALLRGDWGVAIFLQPLIAAAIMTGVLGLAYAWGVAWFGWRYPAVKLNRREKWGLGITVTAAVVANWVYLVSTGV